MIVSYEFLKFFHYLCISKVEDSHFMHIPSWVTVFRWPRKIQVNFRYIWGSVEGTDDSGLTNFWKFLQYSFCEVKKTHFWAFATQATMFGWPQKLRSCCPVQAVLIILSYGFVKFRLLFSVYKVVRNPLLQQNLGASYQAVRVTSKIWVNFRF